MTHVRDVHSNFSTEPVVMLNLNTPDFTTASRLSDGINKLLGAGTAQAVDAVSVKVAAPADPSARISFVAELQVGTVNVREVPGYRLELTPFGGIKDSGLGYKEGVQEAMKSFTNVKTYSLPWT